MSIGPFVDLGVLLSLDSTTLQSGVNTYGGTVACGSQEFTGHGVVTFHDGASPDIVLVVEADDAAPNNTGFAPVNFIVGGKGPADSSVTFKAADGLSQKFNLQTDNIYGRGLVRVGAQSSGAPVADDAVTFRGSASVY